MSGSRINEIAYIKVVKMLRRPRTADELAGAAGVDLRTIYRYLRRLEDEGAPLARLGMSRPVRYRLLDAF